jgi:hypothetical protein
VKSIRIAATTLPFAGDAETGISIGRRAEGTPTFRSTRRTDDQGCSNRVGGGDLTILPHGLRPRGRRRTFAPIGSAHTRNQAIASPTLGATDGGCANAASHAALAKSGDPRRSTSGQPCTVRSRRRRCGVTRCLLSPGRARAVARRGISQPIAARSEGQRGGTGGDALLPPRARIGRSRSCSRVVVVAEVDRQCPAKRSGRPPFHPIWRRSRTVA